VSASDAFETSLLGLIFTNVNAANVGDATGLRGSTTAGVFYVSLHTADPTDAGTQSSSEAGYTNYARVSIARDTSNWTVTNDVADNDSTITFATCGVTGATVTYFLLGSATSGAGNHFLNGALSASLAISSGITPSFAAGALDCTCS
jgi:hypothetical protein